MGGHFDAVGFGDPLRGFAATQSQLRAAVREARLLGQQGELSYYALETPSGCGLVAATDSSGYLLGGCPYYRGRLRHTFEVQRLVSWGEESLDQGGIQGRFLHADDTVGPSATIALPTFGLHGDRPLPWRLELLVTGLGYSARAYRTLESAPLAGRSAHFSPTPEPGPAPPNRVCNAECRGVVQAVRVEQNERTGAELITAQIDCAQLHLDIVIDRASLDGEIEVGGILEGIFWLVGLPAN